MAQQINSGPGRARSRSYQARKGTDDEPRGSIDGQFRPSAASRGSPEGRFMSEPGKALGRHLAELQDRNANSHVRVIETKGALERAETAVEARKARHRGGHRTWLLRSLIPMAIVAEGVTAYVGMEVLVPSLALAVGLAALAAFVGAGMAGVIANRRLNRLPVSTAARILEAVFVVVLTLLRYDSLHIQGADLMAAAGGAALAALISAAGLLGIEEILVETETFTIFAGRIRAAWCRTQHQRATTQLNMIRTRVQATGEKLAQQFVGFLLQEEMPLDEARQRATALSRALTNGGTAE
jgi:hypothetical protein